MSRKKQTVRLGSYARLSRDDGEDGVSNSIVNQQQIMRQYCERHAGLAIVREYADDGFSGTTFRCPLCFGCASRSTVIRLRPLWVIRRSVSPLWLHVCRCLLHRSQAFSWRSFIELLISDL